MRRWRPGDLPEIDTVVSRIVEIVPERCKSSGPIFLFGSRTQPAGPGGPDVDSDYDIAVTMPTCRAFLAYQRFRRVSHELSDSLGVPVSVNPIPEARVRSGDGNLMVLKMRRQGILLLGDDPAGDTVAAPSDTPLNNQHLFLTFLVAQLLKTVPDSRIDPDWPNRASDIGKSAIKALNGCAELALLRHNIMEATVRQTAQTLKRLTLDTPGAREARLADDLSALFESSASVSPSEAERLWRTARSHVLDTVSDLASQLDQAQSQSSSQGGKINRFDESLPRSSSLRELQYLVGVLLTERRVRFTVPWSHRKGTDLSVRQSMLLALSAFEPPGGIDDDLIRRAWQRAGRGTGLPRSAPDSNVEMFAILRRRLLAAFPNACRVLGA